ncbi:MAG: anhydro-N-acetylmuramic acid kinase [Flavobacteriaceae bacterium]|jgi:anhydro-N-acetylmuramic acid kinase|nr:anhydro-N-acetylmuramic acid kinase [Flavobacteriaceae bacterium]
MNKSVYYIVGVMSGTSLDGIDMAYIRFEYDGVKWNFKILNAQTVAYSKEWKRLLQGAINLNRKELEAFDERYTTYLAHIISNFIAEYKLIEIDAICSHGHTIFHKPELGYTLQIGNLGILADLLQQRVVCDFRVQDVLLGGQGAPLVPIGDRLLFSTYDACLNLGGFANVSFENKLGYRIAYDICPVNVLLNAEAYRLGKEYDDKGKWAAEGKICDDLLNELNSLSYYGMLPPKSLGIEFVQSFVHPLVMKYNLSPKDALATYVEHIAMQIGQGIPLQESSRILVTGGGAFNDYLLSRIQFYGNNKYFETTERLIVEFKEALIFGFLGVLKLRDEVNVLASVTGAKYDHSSGRIFNCYQDDSPV